MFKEWAFGIFYRDILVDSAFVTFLFFKWLMFKDLNAEPLANRWWRNYLRLSNINTRFYVPIETNSGYTRLMYFKSKSLSNIFNLKGTFTILAEVIMSKMNTNVCNSGEHHSEISFEKNWFELNNSFFLLTDSSQFLCVTSCFVCR